MGKTATRNADSVLAGKPEGKAQLERLRCSWRNNFKKFIKEPLCDGVVQDTDNLWALVNT
jgi:hypothetical protein